MAEIYKGIEIIDKFPALYIKEIDALVISDLHLGYEGSLRDKGGIMIPRVQLKREKEMILEILKIKGKIKKIILNGDIKHDFSGLNKEEREDVKEMFEFLKENFEEIIAVKGNHDNHIYYLARDLEIKLVDEYIEGKYLFIHGDKEFEKDRLKEIEYVIIGNEHPAIALYDEIGVKEKISCFLIGKIDKKRRLIVLPAFSTFASGSEVNMIPKENLLSPVLRNSNLDKFMVYGFSKETGVLEFGELGKLRKISKK